MPPPIDIDPEDEDYASEEDSDFAPEGDAGDAAASDVSASEDEGAEDRPTPTSPGKRKRKAATNGDANEAEDAGFENSGDEAIIEKGKKRRKKSRAKDVADAEEDDGGEGGLIKTRSMRAVEQAERRIAAASGPVTVDVDALWAQMTSDTTTLPTSTTLPSSQDESQSARDIASVASPQRQKQTQQVESELIRIKRTYNFAGKVHTEEKLVHRESAEAKLYLASLGENGVAAAAAEEEGAAPKRMPRKAFRSAFEPIFNEQQLSKRSDLNLGMSVRLRAREEAASANAKKLNTVEKSRMDWAGYVDKEGIKDELELAGKSKDSFAARQDFLARSEMRRDEDARRVRLAGKV
ncbi:swr complex subunit [Diplogelasinospora grovesii]|uniref:SWR1-complex protein 5 n=1 Tax=Diplogelasinospora grovesii TaxID=303347 RepID=A0AAN6NCR5_9PEZI|nr:swr complex subunit [Diplogelasinospora grovesii]